MDEEQLLALQEAVLQGGNVDALTLGSVEGANQRLIELTPEIAAQRSVVNTAREQGRPQGVTNFLANPEVQATLAAFGRAFAAPRGEAGAILAEFTENRLAQRGNTAALQAAESGQPIAEAGGQFADPGLVAGLQQESRLAEASRAELGLSREQFQEAQRQFNTEVGFRERITRLQETGQSQDIALRTAAQALDKESFESRADLLERQFQLETRVQEKQIEYTNFLISQEGKNNENLALRTTEFLEILDQQEQLLNENLEQLRRQIESVESVFFNRGTSFNIFGPGAIGPGSSDVRGGVREIQSRGGTTPDPALRDPVLRELNALLKAEQEKLGRLRSQKDLVTAVQASRLGAGTAQNTSTSAPTQARNIVIIRSPAEARTRTPGTLVQFDGQVFQVERGGIRPRPDIPPVNSN